MGRWDKLLKNQDYKTFDWGICRGGRSFLLGVVLTVGPLHTCLPWFVDGFVCLDEDQTLFIFNHDCGPLLEFLGWSFHLDSEEHDLLIGWRSWDLKHKTDPKNPFSLPSFPRHPMFLSSLDIWPLCFTAPPWLSVGEVAMDRNYFCHFTNGETEQKMEENISVKEVISETHISL